MESKQTSFKAAFLILIFLVLSRGACLEMGDLVDPTEARYAAVAQNMLLTHNWVTPMLPSADGLEPYFGKPPLHFWLTAISYKLLGVEEWTSRLPSYLLAIGSLFLAYALSRKLRDSSRQEGVLAALITLVSPLFFIMAGASTVDLTLSFFVVLAFVAFAYWADSQNRANSTGWAVIAGVTLALGFLTKGPLILVLLGVGVLPWLYLTRNFALLKEIPWIKILLVFLVLTVPWFWLAEKAYPGFIRYYVWTEHLGRYLVSDYGDRYGSGHVYIRGTVWIMLLIAMFPWSLLLLEALFRKNFRGEILKLCREDTWFLYALLGGLAPALFFTLVRQLHTAYVLPGIPLLAVVAARAITRLSDRLDNTHFSALRFAPGAALTLCGAAVLTSPWLGASEFSLLAAMSIFVLGLCFAGYFTTLQVQRAFRTAALLGTFLTMLLPLSTAIVNERKSTEGILRAALQEIEQRNPDIGIAHNNIYSAFWLARAWPQELGEPVTVSFVDINSSAANLPANILMRKVNAEQTKLLNSRGYAEKLKTGSWSWFARN